MPFLWLCPCWFIHRLFIIVDVIVLLLRLRSRLREHPTHIVFALFADSRTCVVILCRFYPLHPLDRTRPLIWVIDRRVHRGITCLARPSARIVLWDHVLCRFLIHTLLLLVANFVNFLRYWLEPTRIVISCSCVFAVMCHATVVLMTVIPGPSSFSYVNGITLQLCLFTLLVLCQLHSFRFNFGWDFV